MSELSTLSIGFKGRGWKWRLRSDRSLGPDAAQSARGLSALGPLWLNQFVRIIYFSPHLDDAVLSAGGIIRKQTAAGIPVEIWTFMSGAPEVQELAEFARTMHQVWGYGTPAEAVEIRRAEDRRAAAQVGAKAVHFDFLDCIYRRGKSGEGLYSDAALPIHPEDADLPAQVAQAMIAWLKPEDTVVCQLAIGRHVDHVIVRKAAEMLQRALTYDADIPYVLNHPDELAPSIAGMQDSFQPVSEDELRSWIEAVSCYASQVESIFGSWDLMHERLRTHWSEQRGVHFWNNNQNNSKP